MIPTFVATVARLADMWGMHDGGGWGPAMWIGILLFWVAAIVLVVWLIRGGLAHTGAHRRESALDVLDRSLADGTISPDGYRERRALLTGEPTSPGSAGDQPGA